LRKPPDPPIKSKEPAMPIAIEAPTLQDGGGIRHGFYGRAGGVSEGIYGSLNCGLGSRDERERVTENRSRVCRHLGGRGDRVVTLFQVHSPTALVVDGPFPPGEIGRADALVTRTRGLVIGALAADCTPVLYADAQAGVIAAAHAGWRGALAGVLEATVAAMEGIGADRRRIRAAIGPTIGPTAYEVGPEFEAQFLAASPANARFFHRPKVGARPYFDLPGYVGMRLEGLMLASVESVTQCTYSAESSFFSYRRATHRGEPDYGRQVSAIVVT
jgi:hypothetical protein